MHHKVFGGRCPPEPARAQLTIDAKLKSPDPSAFIGEALWGEWSLEVK